MLVAAVHMAMIVAMIILRFVLQIHFLFFILSCILYFCVFLFPHPGGTSHGSPVRTDPFGLHYLILLLFVFFWHICNFMVTKPNKVNKKKESKRSQVLDIWKVPLQAQN